VLKLFYRWPTCWASATLAFILFCSGSVQAQLFEQASMSREDRDKQLDELAAEVTALEKQGLLLGKLVRLATPSVVHIDAGKPNEEGRMSRRSLEEAGSGVIIQVDNQNYIVTNRHVIDQAPLANIKIKLDDGRSLRPTKKWEDPETDLAILSVLADGLVAARIGDSDKVDIGDFVLAVGSPFGLSHSVTFGIISAKGRRDLELGDGTIKYQDFFQTDAAINPGNSGGPLLNLRGEVIGINTAIASSSGGSEGIGFTIPINMVTTVANQFVRHGKVMRAYLGVELTDEMTPDIVKRLGLTRPRGALVKGIKPGTPAAVSGLREDDVILEFDGHRIEDDEHLIKIVAFTQTSKEVNVVVFRQGKTSQLKLKVGDRTEFPNP
jgi:serine protease Do